MPDFLQYFLFLGCTALMFLLRLDARRFGAAEWDTEEGDWRAWASRLSWYVAGIALALFVFALHPQPVTELNLVLALDRGEALALGLLYGLAGSVAAFALAIWRSGRLRLPRPGRYPGAVLSSIGTAFFDEFLFRGVILGLLLGLGLPGWLAIVTAAFIYAGTLRAITGGRGLLMLLVALAIGLASGTLVLLTAGIAAALVGHAITRFALFLSMGHPGRASRQRAAVGDANVYMLPPAGWVPPDQRMIGVEAQAPSPAPDLEPVCPARDWLPQPPAGIYVHVPFCVSRCPYCDFVVHAGAAARGPRNRIAELVSALHAELDLRADLLDGRFGAPGGARPALASVYVGGGTPSLLPARVVRGLLRHIEDRLGLAAGAEVTLEANPGRDELGDLEGFREAGVTRLSIGAQSLAAAELRVLGRRHSPADVGRAVSAARQAGIGSVSLDLLTDLPDQSVRGWRRTLGAALDLEPDHLSVYALSLDDPDAEGLTGLAGDHLPLQRGARAWRERARQRQSQDRAADMEAVTEELTAAAGLRRYEIANWSRPGHQSRHNLLYWRRRAYLALGPGAHASDGALRRTWNAAPLDGYVAALGAGTGFPRLPPGGQDDVDPDTARAESAILGLRLSNGIDASLAGHRLIAPALKWAEEEGLLERDERPRGQSRWRAREAHGAGPAPRG